MDPAAAGAIAGTIHHLFIQYPNQAKLFTTLYAFAFANALFVTLLLGAKDLRPINRISRMSIDIVIFNIIYVCPPFEN